ncbi:MAG: hypothetical protein LBE13_12165 [Bacteroidales bacterium]|jgi:hypothetical protein|nr:hypothetical protein [Bacteroidales bacterium]
MTRKNSIANYGLKNGKGKDVTINAVIANPTTVIAREARPKQTPNNRNTKNKKLSDYTFVTDCLNV